MGNREDNLRLALSQNFENARNYESYRTKYGYFYFVAIGALFVFLSQAEMHEGQTFLYVIGKMFSGSNPLDCFESAVLSIIFLIFALIGSKTYFYVVYINIELKNNIRIIEFISEDIGLNDSMKEYRDTSKETKKKIKCASYKFYGLLSKESDKIKKLPLSGERTTAIALPLMFGIREKIPMLLLINVASGFFYFLFFHILFSWFFMGNVCLKIIVEILLALLIILYRYQYNRLVVNTADLELEKRKLCADRHKYSKLDLLQFSLWK